MSEIQQEKRIPKKYSIEIDLKRSVSNTDFEVVEGDTENYLDVILTENGEPIDLEGHRVVAVFSHSGGCAVQDSADPAGYVTIEDNVVKIHMKTGSFRRGVVECELKIYDSDPMRHSTTPSFNFTCRPSLVTDKAVNANSEISIFDGLISQAHTAVSLANQANLAAQKLPRVYVAYSDKDPIQDSTAVISSQRADFMGIFYSENGMPPSSAQDYTWCDTRGVTSISGVALSQNGELEFTMSDNRKITSTNMRSSVERIVNSTNNIRSLSVSESTGDMTITMKNNATIEAQGISGYVSGRISASRPRALTNVVVPSSAWAVDSTLPGYSYAAAVPLPFDFDPSSCTGNVLFSASDAVSGSFAPIAKLTEQGVMIWCKHAHILNIEIPLIVIEEVTVIE